MCTPGAKITGTGVSNPWITKDMTVIKISAGERGASEGGIRILE
tara:strand:- start:2610 stop:2741 length:132 start_codon:yes stop_codon:yes gene_type:complete